VNKEIKKRRLASVMSLDELKNEIIQTKSFQRLTTEEQQELLAGNYLEHLFQIVNEIIYLQ
jgi:hypothetical protein